jgi:hypothetical protein
MRKLHLERLLLVHDRPILLLAFGNLESLLFAESVKVIRAGRKTSDLRRVQDLLDLTKCHIILAL